MKTIVSWNIKKLNNDNFDNQSLWWVLWRWANKNSLSYTKHFACKIAQHKKWEKREIPKANPSTNTMSVLLSGKMKQFYPELWKEVLLDQYGDYVVYQPWVLHTREVLEDCVMVTVERDVKETIWDERNEEKKYIDWNDVDNLYVNIREIRFIKLGKNIWSEQNGKKGFVRPFLVMKKIWNQLRWVPLTTGWKNDSLFYDDVPAVSFHDDHHQQKSSKVCLWHAKTIDKKRFVEKIWVVNQDYYVQLQKKLQTMYL